MLWLYSMLFIEGIYMRFWFSILLLGLVTTTVVAIEVDDLYRASVPVSDQSENQRKSAMRVALAQVVQKVTGRQSVVSSAALQQSFANTGSFVEQFQYKKNVIDASLDDAPLNAGFAISILFHKESIDAVLKQHNIPVWGRNRPSVLTWLAVESGRQRYLVSTDNEGLAALLTQAGENAGLTFTLPLMDLQDQRTVSFNDVWGGFSDRIEAASKRYGVDQIVFARALKSPQGGWKLNWSLLNKQGLFSGQLQQQTLKHSLNAGAASVAEKLADIYAPYGLRSESAVTLNVDGIADLASFARVAEYLAGLESVKKLSWQHVELNKAVFVLAYEGELTVLQDLIRLNNVLAERPLENLPIVPLTPVATGQTATTQAASVYQEILYYRVSR